jgi:hypothetical protein
MLLLLRTPAFFSPLFSWHFFDPSLAFPRTNHGPQSGREGLPEEDEGMLCLQPYYPPGSRASFVWCGVVCRVVLSTRKQEAKDLKRLFCILDSFWQAAGCVHRDSRRSAYQGLPSTAFKSLGGWRIAAAITASSSLPRNHFLLQLPCSRWKWTLFHSSLWKAMIVHNHQHHGCLLLSHHTFQLPSTDLSLDALDAWGRDWAGEAPEELVSCCPMPFI